MRSLSVLLLPALAAGCHSAPTVTAANASVKEVHDKVAAAGGNMDMRPGRWEGTVTVRNATPGTDPQYQSGVLNSQLLRLCVAPGQTGPANPVVARMQAGCTYDNFKLANGHLDATMTCQHQGVTLKTKVKGDFGPDRYTLSNVTEAAGASAGPLAGIKSETEIDARRVGECRGDETAKKGPTA